MEEEGRLETSVYGRATRIQPRVLAALLLILAALVWAVARGLSSFGVGPADLGYDLDQPPVLLLLVGVWLLWRSRSR